MFDRLFKRRSTGLEQASHNGARYAVHASLDELLGLRMLARQLTFSSKIPSSNLMIGNHLSRFKGRGMDYLESRDYQPGDDIRNMDWRVTARTGQPHIKLFQEERQRPVLIMLDLNPGMFFASHGRFKSAIASQATALLAWAAAHNGDRVGGLILNQEHIEQPPRGNKNGMLAFLHQIATHSEPVKHLDNADPALRFSNGLRRLSRMAKPGSLVFIVSDFYHIDDIAIQQLMRLKAGSEIVLIRVLDSLENQAPPANRYAVTDGTSHAVLNTADKKQAERYRQWFDEHHQQLSHVSQQLAIPLVELVTHEHPIQQLRKVFSTKAMARKPVIRKTAGS